MDEIENNKPTQDFDDGIDLVKWFFVLAQGKRIIIYLTTFFHLLELFIVFPYLIYTNLRLC